ncbi:PREDICTED: transcription elongation factor SPT5-like [Ceratosolen solmsi marchali]|uniref:Transcription elongation factor SPT5 n=1 Tax=Ceratosolen solmsi marchali TaxID=326594 RepID=A0AAJ6VKW9_9HYME|nr:PREDICTED: transcription elongation factor SPT5-like [Ceratosolen solmsi marchali]
MFVLKYTILKSLYKETIYYSSTDEEYQQNNKKKKKSKKIGSDFILQEAEVDDDVDDEEEWEEGVQEIGIIEKQIDEVGPTAREIEGRRRVSDLWNLQKQDEIEKYLKNKYSNGTAISYHFGDGVEQMNDEITQQNLLPDIKDPNLWLIKCKIGEENSTILLLMRKFLTYQYTDNPLVIKSAIIPKGIKGFIYIEAFKQVHVKAAIENICSLKMGFWQQMMVPIKEMTDVFRVRNQVNLRSNQWVRIKRGIYKDDIAQIDYVDIGQNKVHLKLLPRIDYSKLRGPLRLTTDNNERQKRKKSIRPLAKPFDAEAIRAIGGEVTSNGDYLIFEGNYYTHKGYLYKNFKINGIITESVKPTIEEIEKFEESPENINIELSDPPITGFVSRKEDLLITHNFYTGDNVEVCRGELMHLQGKILSIDGNTIMILPNHKELTDPIDFMAYELKKYFSIGNHVKVVGGEYIGDTGLIVRIKNDRIILFSDISMHELEVLSDNLQLCPDMATGVDSFGKFQWGDLVQLEPQTVGVIIQLQRADFQVLSMHGKLVDVKPGSLIKYRENKHTIALDMFQESITRKDIVKVVDGPHSGRDGEIKHLYRSFAFLHSKIYIETGGIFVCKTRHLQLVGGNKSVPIGFNTPVYASPSYSEKSKNATRLNNFGPVRDKKLIGTTIKITGGPYKGNIGFVKDATESTVRVELHSPCHTISVDRSHIITTESNVGKSSTHNYTPTYCPGARTPMYGSKEDSKASLQGSQTPMYDNGARTPYYGSVTPSQDELRLSGISGAWDPSVLNTPARSIEYNDTTTDEDSVPEFSPMYQDSQSIGPLYDPEETYDHGEASPSPVSSIILSPNPNYTVTVCSSETGFLSPQMDYTPSSPTESNKSVASGDTKISYYG